MTNEEIQTQVREIFSKIKHEANNISFASEACVHFMDTEGDMYTEKDLETLKTAHTVLKCAMQYLDTNLEYEKAQN